MHINIFPELWIFREHFNIDKLIMQFSFFLEIEFLSCINFFDSFEKIPEEKFNEDKEIKETLLCV